MTVTPLPQKKAAPNYNTFLRWLDAHSPRWMLADVPKRLIGTAALMTDMLADGARQATKMHIPHEETPSDALRLISSAWDLPWWPSETERCYRDRLTYGPFGYHSRRYTPACIVEQCGYAGYTVEVVEPPDESLVFPDFKIKVFGFGVQPCTSYIYGTTAPAYGSSWYYGTSLPGPVVLELQAIVKWCKPKRSRLVGFSCP